MVVLILSCWLQHVEYTPEVLLIPNTNLLSTFSLPSVLLSLPLSLSLPPPPLSPGYKYPEVSELEMSAGDAVMVQADPDVFKVAQVGHGGWDDRVAEVSH